MFWARAGQFAGQLGQRVFCIHEQRTSDSSDSEELVEICLQTSVSPKYYDSKILYTLFIFPYFFSRSGQSQGLL